MDKEHNKEIDKEVENFEKFSIEQFGAIEKKVIELDWYFRKHDEHIKELEKKIDAIQSKSNS